MVHLHIGKGVVVWCRGKRHVYNGFNIGKCYHVRLWAEETIILLSQTLHNILCTKLIHKASDSY